MAYAGQVLTNPVSGETIEFLQTSADTDVEVLAIDLTLTPDGHVCRVRMCTRSRRSGSR